MDYGKVVSRSWKIVWENKWLLVLGFLAALGGGGGSGGSSNFNYRNSGSGSSGSPFDNVPNVEAFWSDYGTIIIAAACFLFILSIVLWLLRLVGEAGMIDSVNKIEVGQKVGLSQGFSAGTGFLPRMAGLSLLLALPTLIVLGLIAVVGIVVFALTGSGGEAGFGFVFACIVPIICLVGIYGFIVQFIYPFAQRSIILDGFGVVDSLKHGYNVLRENFSEIIILAIIFLVIGFVVGIATLFVIGPVILVSMVPVIISLSGGGSVSAGAVVFAVIGVIVTILLAAAIGSVQRAWQSTAFTLGYRDWTGKHKLSEEVIG